jgi:hypothetical protein
MTFLKSKDGIVCLVQVDITVNNILALVNTKLLGDYCKVDERLVQLATIVKTWAKNRNVNDSYRGTLSSYCYVLMCIHLLQQREKPVLPCLHSITPPTVSRFTPTHTCWYFLFPGTCLSNLMPPAYPLGAGCRRLLYVEILVCAPWCRTRRGIVVSLAASVKGQSSHRWDLSSYA